MPRSMVRLPRLFRAAAFLAVFLGAAVAESSWKEDWDKSVQAAKKEGQLTVYMNQFERVVDSFKREYPRNLFR